MCWIDTIGRCAADPIHLIRTGFSDVIVPRAGVLRPELSRTMDGYPTRTLLSRNNKK